MSEDEHSNTVNLTHQLTLWKQHEDIAMHFNELIARIRVQALGGTVTIVTVAAVVTDKNPEGRWALPGVLGFLAVAWTALWQLDYRYYQMLLAGAVNAIVELERKLHPHVSLSTVIEGKFNRRGAPHGHFWFYALIQFALLFLLGAATFGGLKTPWSEQSWPYFTVGGVLAGWFIFVTWVAWPRRKTESPPAR